MRGESWRILDYLGKKVFEVDGSFNFLSFVILLKVKANSSI